ncbi:MAG: hypothetical protein ACRC50_09780, partial [Gaiella sp.]
MSPSQAVASISDHDLVAAVAAQEEWIEALLHRLVATPTTLGNEDPGQEVVAEALRELGLEPLDVPMD